MLDEVEYIEVSRLYREGMDATKEFRRSLEEELSLQEEQAIRSKPLLDRYEQMTGMRETNPDSVMKILTLHRRSRYGPPCHRCGKPLRTPQAKLCGSCMAPRKPCPANTMQNAQDEFALFSAPLDGLPVSRVWQGWFGEPIFLEFGQVQPRRDSSHGTPRGEWTLMIERPWRIEGKRRIWCDSSSDGARWPRAFKRIEGARVVSICLHLHLPEIELTLSNGLHVLSTAWALTRNDERIAYVSAGGFISTISPETKPQSNVVICYACSGEDSPNSGRP
jgi:hypothetical protein